MTSAEEWQSPIRAEWRSRRVLLRDGTRGGGVLAAAGVAAFVVGALAVVGWQHFPGGTETLMRSAVPVSLPRSAVVAACLIVAVAAALVAWHSAGARTVRPTLALAGVGVGGLLVALVQFAWADRLAEVAGLAPSFASATRRASDQLVVAGVVAAVAGFLVAAVGWHTHRHVRRLMSAGAAVPWVALAWAYTSVSDQPVVDFVRAIPASDIVGQMVEVRRGTTTWLSTTMVPTVALVAVAVVAVVAVLGVYEFAQQKTAMSGRLARFGVPATSKVIACLGGLVVILLVLGRLDLVPGARDSIPALSKPQAESWVLAGAFAVAAIGVMHRAERLPVSHRGLFAPALAMGVLLTSGHLVFAFGRILEVVGRPFTDSLWWRGQMVSNFAGWAEWCFAWTPLIVPVVAAVAGLWLRRCGERSDRTVLLLSVAALAILPGLKSVLIHRHVDSFLDDIVLASADQVMIVIAVALAAAALVGRGLLEPQRVVRVQLLVLLATFVAALLGTATTNRYFQLGLVVPLITGLLRTGDGRGGRPARGALALAGGGVLTVLLTAGLVNGFVGASTSALSEQYVFLVLSGPLLLASVVSLRSTVIIGVTDGVGAQPSTNAEIPEPMPAASGETPAVGSPSTRRGSSPWVLMSVAGAMMLVAGAGASAVTDADAGDRPRRVDVVVQNDWVALQEESSAGEVVWLLQGEIQVNAASVAGAYPACAATVLSSARTGDEGADAGFVGHLPARRYEVVSGTGGLLTCGELVSDEGTTYVVILHPQPLTDADLAQLDRIAFAVSSTD